MFEDRPRHAAVWAIFEPIIPAAPTIRSFSSVRNFMIFSIYVVSIAATKILISAQKVFEFIKMIIFVDEFVTISMEPPSPVTSNQLKVVGSDDPSPRLSTTSN